MTSPIHDLGYYQGLETSRLLEEAHIHGLNANNAVAIAERLQERATHAGKRRHFQFNTTGAYPS